jgi:hypothetical protein
MRHEGHLGSEPALTSCQWVGQPLFPKHCIVGCVLVQLHALVLLRIRPMSHRVVRGPCNQAQQMVALCPFACLLYRNRGLALF